MRVLNGMQCDETSHHARIIPLAFQVGQNVFDPVQRRGSLSVSGDDVLRQFQSQTVRPLLALATADPGEALRVIEVIREKLEALEKLLDGDESGSGSASSPMLQTAVSGGGAAGATHGAEHELIGRNQRSRIREMTLLQVLSSEARPFSLHQLIRSLEGDGFADGTAAVVSQLHRMKKVGIIEQPANGMYEITQDGLSHLRQLRASFGSLVKG